MSLWLQQFLQALDAEEIETNSLVSLNSGVLIREECRTQKAIVAIESNEAIGFNVLSNNTVEKLPTILDFQAIEDDYEDRASIKEYEANIPREKAEIEAFDAAIRNYQSSTNLTNEQNNSLNIYIGLHHPAVKLAQNIFGGEIKTVTINERTLWRSKSE